MTEKKPPSIDAHRMRTYGGYSVTQKIATRTRQRELFAKTRTRYKIRQAWEHGNYAATFSLVGGSFEPSKHKGLLLGTFMVSVILFGVGWGVQPNNPLFHSLSNNDPATVLWQATGPNNDLGEFNAYAGTNGGKAVFKANCFNGANCIDEGSDTSVTSVALSKSTVGDLSVVSGKELQWVVGMLSTSSTVGANARWGWFLTTNSTIPKHDVGSTNAYNPRDDPSVFFVQNFACISSCGIAGSTVIEDDTMFLRTQGNSSATIATEDAGCGGSSSVFMCGSATFNPATAGGWTSTLVLNFTARTNASTGCTSGLGNGCSSELTTFATMATSTTLPWFSYQSNQFYVGFYLMSGLSAEIYFALDNGSNPSENRIIYGVSTPTAVIVSPSIDSGGFFGPIIKALISLGVFMLSAVFQFFAYVWNALKAGLDLLGNFLGLGPIGTAITNAFQGFVTWISAVLGSVFGNVGNVATSIGSELTAIGNVAGSYFSNLGNILTQLSNFGSQFWGVMTTLKLVGTVSSGFILAAWMLWGAVLAFQDIDKFWNQWYRTTGFAILWVFKVLWWSGEAGYGVMLKIKSLIWPTSSGGGIVQTPA